MNLAPTKLCLDDAKSLSPGFTSRDWELPGLPKSVRMERHEQTQVWWGRQLHSQVSDEGGGIPRSDVPRIFTYLYSTASSPLSDMDDTGESDGPAVLAGYGYGLPISRLYARYFGPLPARALPPGPLNSCTHHTAPLAAWPANWQTVPACLFPSAHMRVELTDWFRGGRGLAWPEADSHGEGALAQAVTCSLYPWRATVWTLTCISIVSVRSGRAVTP